MVPPMGGAMTEPLIWIAPLIFLIAGTIKGAIGIGLPTTVIAGLSLFVDPRIAVALGLAPMIASNVWQVRREGGWRAPMRRFWPLALTTAAFLFAASQFAAGAEGGTILAFTGLAVAIFAAASLIGTPPVLPPSWERPGQVVAGGLAGIMGGLTGIWSPPMLILLLSLRLDKSDFIRSIGLLLLLGAAPLLLGYVLAGLMTAGLFAGSLALCLSTFAGFALGERLRRTLDPAKFQKAVLIFFLVMGMNMIRQAVW